MIKLKANDNRRETGNNRMRTQEESKKKKDKIRRTRWLS
jgi:hypothetical protein